MKAPLSMTSFGSGSTMSVIGIKLKAQAQAKAQAKEEVNVRHNFFPETDSMHSKSFISKECMIASSILLLLFSLMPAKLKEHIIPTNNPIIIFFIFDL